MLAASELGTPVGIAMFVTLVPIAVGLLLAGLKQSRQYGRLETLVTEQGKAQIAQAAALTDVMRHLAEGMALQNAANAALSKTLTDHLIDAAAQFAQLKTQMGSPMLRSRVDARNMDEAAQRGYTQGVETGKATRKRTTRTTQVSTDVDTDGEVT